VPGAPGVFVLFGHVLHGDGKPGEAAVGRAFDSFCACGYMLVKGLLSRRATALSVFWHTWPSSTTAISPSLDFNGAIVYHDLFCPG